MRPRATTRECRYPIRNEHPPTPSRHHPIRRTPSTSMRVLPGPEMFAVTVEPHGDNNFRSQGRLRTGWHGEPIGQRDRAILRQHVDNLVDWRSWDADALAEAGCRDMPIPLSIGDASCHLCGMCRCSVGRRCP
ncbi:DUF255 domain-containing protein [Nocardia sp. bgisy134]|uniref:DUF255 domain-containing protein n=1 Tax=unclassified Nocardia TaxID=2637762 RepID=UPI003D705A74